MTRVTGFETPATSWDQDTTWQLNLSNTSYGPGDPEVGVTFMAPTSGRILLVIGGGGRDNTGNNRVFLGHEIYIGTQALQENLLFGPDFNEFVIPGEADESIYGSRAIVYNDLVPLRQHYARLVQRRSGTSDPAEDTPDIFVREVVVVPLP